MFFDFEVDLEIPEIVSIIFCKGADGVHHAARRPFLRQGRSSAGASAAPHSKPEAAAASAQGAGPLQESCVG